MRPPLIIEAAINGATPAAMNPHVPRTAAAIVACARACLDAGAHVRVGLEDYGGPRQPSNQELIAEIVTLAARAGRAIATPAEAAALLGISNS